MRLLYSMFKEPIPKLTGDLNKDILNMYEIYKKQYNSYKGKTTYDAFCKKAHVHGVNYNVIRWK